MKSQKILSITDVCHLIHRSRKTLWTWVNNGDFPEPIRLRGRAIGWPESVYQEWIAKQMEGY